MTRNNRTTITLMVLALLTAACISALAARTQTDGQYIYESRFKAEHDLTGLFSYFQESFMIGDWDVSGASLSLCFSSTPLAWRDVSDFTVSLNGQRFYSSRLPDSRGETYQIDIPLPLDALAKGTNVLELESYIRTNESDSCRDDISKASWMTIFDDSTISLTYTPMAKVESVAELYEQLGSIEALDNDQTAIYINANATDAELTAAGLALSGVAMNAQMDCGAIDLTRAFSADSLCEKKYGVYISEYATMFESVRSMLSAEQKKAAESGAVAVLLKPAKGVSLLLVTGADTQALLNAGNLFGNKEYMRQSVYTWRITAGAEDVTFRQDKGKARLTETGTYLRGPFRQSTLYYVQLSADRVLKAGSEVYIEFRYSENLDFNRSLMTVYINETPIGSKRLTFDGAKGDSARFSIPEDIGAAGNFTVRAAFDLEIQDLVCTMRQDQMPWAYIVPSSEVTLVSEETDSLLFDYYPVPFVKDGAFNDLVFILPNEPTDADIEAMRGMFITFGRFLKDNSGSLRICTNSGTGDISQSNVISIGSLSRNPLARQLNDRLYFKFSPEGTTVLSNEKMRIEANYGAILGTGQLLFSPYSSEKRAFLLVSGVTDENMLKAAAYLSNSERIWEVSGDGFAADGEDIFFYRFKPDNAKSRSWLQKFLERKDVLYTVVVGTAVFLDLLVVAVILFRRRKGR